VSRRSPGEGTICQRKDGRWQGSIQIGRVRRTVYGRTRTEVAQRLADLRRQAAHGLPRPGGRTVADLLEEWLSTTDLRPTTVRHYRALARVHVLPRMGKVRLERVTPERIQRLYASIPTSGVREKVHRLLHRAFRLAVLWGWVLENPCDRVEPPRHRPKRRDLWTPEQLRRFLEGTEDTRWGPLWHFLLASGCRIGEALGLAWGDVDWERGAVTVRHSLAHLRGRPILQEPKTPSGVRVIALPPWGLAALKRQRALQARWRLRAGARWCNAWGLVFTTKEGGPLAWRDVWRAMSTACKRLGLPHMSPHGLRHLHASLLLDAGIPLPAVAKRLGHANTHITAIVYAHALPGQDWEAAQAVERAIGRRSSL